MTVFLLCVAGIFVILSFYGLMASLMRFAAIACVAIGVWFWSQESRGDLNLKLEQGFENLMQRGQNLSSEDKALLKKALEGADSLLENQRKRLKELVEKLEVDTSLKQSEETSAVLKTLRERS